MSHPAATSPRRRLLNHAELVYAPGDRGLARAFLEALGCRVLDPQVGPVPEDLGPAAGPYLIVHIDPNETDLIDNVLYLSEVHPEQWELEQSLREQQAHAGSLSRFRRSASERFDRAPQSMTHLGLALPSVGQLEEVLARVESEPRFRDRFQRSPIYRPGDPGSVDPRVVQAFLYTDICAAGLLAVGQRFELQVRLG